MKISKRFEQALRRARASHKHLAERVKLMFSLSLEQQRRSARLSYSELASRIETSPAYITKVFRGDSNLTIETMAKLAVATGSDLDIRLVDAAESYARWTFPTRAPDHQQFIAAGTVTHLSAANHAQFEPMVHAA